MATEVEDWDEAYGVASFTHRGEPWTAVEVEGNTMTFTSEYLTLSGSFGAYPNPELAERVLEDFRRCVGEDARGDWHLRDRRWVQD